MGNKIEVGEYIRTEDGFIGKVKRIETELEKIDGINIWYKWYVFDKNIGEIHINESYIKEHNFNIINLIEEGDVIVLRDNKKYEVLKISWSKSKGNHIHIINALRMQGGIDIFADDIKSIVTKEQFEIVEYEV